MPVMLWFLVSRQKRSVSILNLLIYLKNDNFYIEASPNIKYKSENEREKYKCLCILKNHTDLTADVYLPVE